MKKVVLDTNVLLVSISQRSRLHWIFQSLIENKYILCVSTEMLAEYAEIIEQHMGSDTSTSVLGVIQNLPNVHWVTAYYRFHLLKDEDDNKFVDCAISANAEYIVTHDKDFNLLKNIEFPKVHILDTDAFKIDLGL